MNSFTATTTNNTQMRVRPRRVADLLIVSSAADGTMNGAARASAHWVAVTPDLSAGEQAPAHVKALAQGLGVDTRVAWAALDGMYG